MTLTPTTKGAFFAGLGFWALLWSVFGYGVLLDFGFGFTVFEWAEGKPLDDVLLASGLAAGDFVRNCKQLLDLLRQIEEVADGGLRASARAAHDAVNRSVVAYTGVDA